MSGTVIKITIANNGFIVDTEAAEPDLRDLCVYDSNAMYAGSEQFAACATLDDVLSRMGLDSKTHDEHKVYVAVLPGLDYRGPLSEDMRETLQDKIKQYQYLLDNCK